MELNNGKYRARATEWDLAEAGTGSPQVAVGFELLDDGYVGRRITWYGYWSDAALEITVKALRACGWKGNDLLELSGLDANEVDLVIENEEYEGQWTPRVKFVNVPGGLAIKAPMSDDKRKAFAAQMRQKIAGLDAMENQGKPAAKPAASKPAGRSRAPAGDRRPEPPPIDSDIPF